MMMCPRDPISFWILEEKSLPILFHLDSSLLSWNPAPRFHSPLAIPSFVQLVVAVAAPNSWQRGCPVLVVLPSFFHQHTTGHPNLPSRLDSSWPQLVHLPLHTSIPYSPPSLGTVHRLFEQFAQFFVKCVAWLCVVRRDIRVDIVVPIFEIFDFRFGNWCLRLVHRGRRLR